MPIDNLARWTILPNWRQPVIERLSWLSAVLTSDSGAEQRFGLRWSPRRSFEPIFTVTGRVRALLDVSLAAAGAAEWYVPVWHDGNVLTAPLSLGAASITTDTAFREFKVGGYVMLWQDEFTAEVHEVTSVGSGTVGIDPVTSREWPIGTRVFPCVRARIGDIPELSRKTGTVFEGGIRFDISTDNDWSDVAATIDLPTYLGYRVLTQRPNRREDLSLRYERMIEDLDADVGLTLRRDVSGLAFPVQSHSWLRLGREEQAKLRALLYDLSGRVTPLWVPTFDDDLLLADDVDAVDTTLLIRNAGFDAFGVPFAGREHIYIRLRDGTHIFRQITGVVASGDTEVVTLSAAVGQTFTRGAVHSVSFMSLCRQNADEVEFNHITDGGNATEVTVSFRHAPDLRSATDIGIPLIGNTAMSAGGCPCIPGIVITSSPFVAPNENNALYYVPNNVDAAGTQAAVMAYTQPTADLAQIFALDEGTTITVASPAVESGMTLYVIASTAITLPPCTALPSGGRLLVQQDGYSSSFYGITHGIWARTYDNAGALVAGPTLLAGIDRTLGDMPGTAVLGGVAFYGVVDTEPLVDILVMPGLAALSDGRLQRINGATHASVVSPFEIAADYALQYYTANNAMIRAGSNLVITYVERDGSGTNPMEPAILVYDGALDLVSGPTRVRDHAGSFSSDYVLDYTVRSIPLADGSFIVGWVRALTDSREFRVRRYSNAGAAISASQVLVTGTKMFPEELLSDTNVSRMVWSFTASADGQFIIVAETVSENANPAAEEQDLWQHLTVFQDIGGTWVQQSTLRFNPTYAQFRDWFGSPFTQIYRMNNDTYLVPHDFETLSTYQVQFVRAALTRCDCTPLLVPTGPYFLLAAASLTGHVPRMFETNMISGDSGAFGFTYMQGAESDGRFVQIAADNTASTRTSTHDSDATSTSEVYTARTSDGRYVVLTGSRYPLIFGGESDIKAQFFSAAGVSEGAAVQIAGAEVYPGGATIKGVVPDDAGGYYYLHFWFDSGAIQQGLNIQRRDASHAALTSRVQVMASADNWGALEGHTLARSGSTLAAAMHRYYLTGKSARLAVSFYDLDLLALATNVEVSDITPLDDDSRDLYVNIRTAPGGQTAVMWVDQPNGDDNFVGATARVRFFLSDGTPAGASQSLFTTGTVDEFSPDDPIRNPTDFVVSASGNYLAVTESVNDYAIGSRVTYLTLFENQSGTWVQVQTRTVDDTPDLGFAYFDYDSRMELLSNGEIVVAYQQYGAGPDNDIRARRFTLTECM